MARKKKQTKSTAYSKQRERVLSFIRRAEKRGYFLTHEFSLPTETELRKSGVKGAKLAARTRQLKRLTPDRLYSMMQRVDIETGELTPGAEARRIERSEIARRSAETRRLAKEAEQAFWSDAGPTKQQREEQYQRQKEQYANFSDTVIHNYRTQIARFPRKVAEIVLTALDEAIKQNGKDAVAMVIESSAESLSDFLSRSAAFGDSIAAVIAYCQAMFGDLPGMRDNPSYSDLIDALEEEEGMGGEV